MPLILSLETSTDVCSVALHKDGKLINELFIRQPQAQAAQLAPLIDSLMKGSTVNPNSVEAVAVSSGPGSYTGLRIGTSTAKGLCFALDIPLVAVPTLLIMASEVQQQCEPDSLLCPMIDARRMEVYCQVFNHKLEEIQPLSATIVENGSFTELLDQQKMLFFGNGSEKCKTVIQHKNALFVDEITPSAAALGLIAIKKYQNHEFESLSDFNPLYLKEFIAKPAKPLI